MQYQQYKGNAYLRSQETRKKKYTAYSNISKTKYAQVNSGGTHHFLQSGAQVVYLFISFLF
jgi:hypothetical protein